MVDPLFETVMHNVEFKAELRDLPLARSLCAALGATYIITMEQTDSYFRIPSGRLKKRECSGEPVEYIFYDRDNRTQPKLSHYTIYSEAQAVERFGTAPLPLWIVVKKTRELYMLGTTRIHLDSVEGLGNFIEFESLVSPSNTVAKCQRTQADLRTKLGPVLGEAISCSYSDLLAAQEEMETPRGPSAV